MTGYERYVTQITHRRDAHLLSTVRVIQFGLHRVQVAFFDSCLKLPICDEAVCVFFSSRISSVYCCRRRECSRSHEGIAIMRVSSAAIYGFERIHALVFALGETSPPNVLETELSGIKSVIVTNLDLFGTYVRVQCRL